ncbi:hypothetical protein ALP73_00499 [Pseudomonas coronafaciens pv. garcae]|uniref:Uncharacterized protein n=3 Tax=Pseudomonas syringae group TaxID=136849 RepID=A0AAE6UJT9_9PSED|nr:hypothetical protein [Pseudomonas coronafaciens]QGT79795.1 hypothetical protein GMO17_00705 [Pseudomonas coronafaciens pv. coronafaciens]QIQ72570.1 hypothetical protein HBB04_02969 [Pseudomonas coronafaciens]RMS00113.1 hypothetical protein ALP74_200577 [Pseudomonas coronafaciens pv. garcae]RMS00819.1 hypothetical protein ALP73_00499 [Pseudomonas coronafaciens pv. garcae]RMS32167.1 hypothetical protein ALP71_02143 [Pseudomonas coronafaciens pv. garcae]
MNHYLNTLRDRGINRALFSLIETHDLTVDPGSYLYQAVLMAAQNGVASDDHAKLIFLDAACLTWIAKGLVPLDSLRTICSVASTFQKSSSEVAEVIAGGLLAQVFPDLEKNAEQKKNKTPDFRLGPAHFAEVYCPQESLAETEKYAKWLKKAVGPISLFVSYPVTSSAPKMVQFSSNSVIDRAVSGKREKNQFSQGNENILWLDFLQGFRVSSSDTKPYATVHKGENTYIESFGIWHSLYGRVGCSFAVERTDLRYPSTGQIYKQRREGLFRERPEASAAVLLVADGILLFENPWASMPLSEATRRSLTQLLWFKPDMSYLSLPSAALPGRIAGLLAEIEWLYSAFYLHDQR